MGPSSPSPMSVPERFTAVRSAIGRRPYAMASVIVISITLIGLFATGTVRIPRSTPPREFGQRQKVSATSVLRMSFPALMDHASAEEHTQLPEGLTGTFSWEDEALTFAPESKLAAGSTYAIRVNGTALKEDGTPLGQDLTFTFVVAGPPAIAVRIPAAGAQDVASSSTVAIVFDRPMIPLTQVQGDAASARFARFPVKISPEVRGRWRWLSTVAAEFIPEKGLTPATRYTVSVPAGMASVSGDATEEDFSWTFETERPRVIATEPAEGFSLAGPGTPLILTFNQKMHPESALPFLSLREGSSESGVVLSIRSSTFGQRTENDRIVTDETTLVLTPAQPLAFGKSYTLTVAPGLKGAEGNLGSQSGSVLHFSTVGPFSVKRATAELGRVEVVFSNPIAEDFWKDRLTISPSVEGWEELVWSLNTWDDNREISAYPALRPSTGYTVTIDAAMADTFGQALGSPASFHFTTPPLEPQLLLDSKGEFGIFERSKPPVYNLNAVNVTRVEAELSAIALPDFLAFRNAHGDTWRELPGARTVLKSWTIQMGKEKDTWEKHSIDLPTIAGQSLGSGIYGLLVRAPEQKAYGYQLPQHVQVFTLTDIALTLKYTGNRALVWATDMRTGEPVDGATVAFYSLAGEKVRTGTTDRDGFFESAIDAAKFATPMNEWEPEFWVTAEKGGDFAFVSSRWNEGIRPDSFGFWTDFWGAQDRPARVHSTLYTDRPLYRAGDTVQFKGIVRLRDRNGAFSIPHKSQSVSVQVTDPNGNQIFGTSLPFSPFGGFNGEIAIDPDAPLGTYSIQGSLPESPAPEIYGSFQVLAYRKPEYRVDVTTQQEEIFDGDTVQATIEGAYYFGAPMSGAPVTWRAQTTDYFFNKITDDWYSFGLDDSWCWNDCNRETKLLTEGKGTLDATGRLSIAVPVSIADHPVSQILSIEADITDPNHQVVSNRTSIPVHKADAYVGIKTEDFVVSPGKDARIAVLTVRPDGSPLPRSTVTLSLFARTWTTVKKKGVDGLYIYDNTPEDTFIRSSTVTTDEKGKAAAPIRIENGGQYRIVAMVEDEEGRQAKAQTSVYAYSSTYINWPATNNARIDVLADKPEYKVGDTATLLIQSPYQGKNVKALVTVEREQVLQKRIITIDSTAQNISIPITEDLGPTAYVSVVIVKPRIGETFDDNGLDTGVPAFRIGYAKLNIQKSRKRITLTVQPDQAQYLPGETAQVKLTASDWQGKPVRAEVSLGVVDMSLLALSGFALPDPVDVFYGNRAGGVLTAASLQYLIDRYKPGSKGGGGADGEARKRGDFRDTAYWNPAILTDENGEATVSFTLPDNLTTWHFLGIAQSKEHTFGAAEATAVETKRVILRPVRPRFGVVGDRVMLGAIVHNFLDRDAAFVVRLSGSGFTVIGQSEQSVTVKQGQMEKVTFPVTLLAAERARFTFLAQSDAFRDEVEEEIPVYTYGTPQSAATTGVTEGSALEKVLVPAEKDARDGTLSIAISPTLATYLPKGLEYLFHFPYGCAEQTLSAVLPSIALSGLQRAGAFQIITRKDLEANVVRGLERLSTFQRGDGGFGYWPESGRSFPYLSAYVLEAFHLMQRYGFAVDQGMIARTQEYLDRALRSGNPRDRVDQATRAYILFVLAETGRKDVSLLNNLDADRDALPLFAKAHLAMAYEKSGSRRKASEIVEEILRSAKVDARGTRFEEEEDSAYASLMHTNDRTTALVLQALLRIDPKNALVPNVVRSLLAARKDGHWDTTQSTVRSLLALVDAIDATEEMRASYTANVDVNGENVLAWEVNVQNVLTRKEVTLALDRLLRGRENPVSLQKEGTGKLYYDLLLSYFYTSDHLPPAEEGIAIQRGVEPVSGQESGKNPSLAVGNTYRVTLTITVPEDRHFVAVESPLPAGMEPIDLSLETAQKSLLQDDTTRGWSEAYWQSGLWRFTHRELRDDSFFAFADELPAGVYQLTYLMRATTPGTFHERPARAWQMYFPEVFGQTAGKLVTIGE